MAENGGFCYAKQIEFSEKGSDAIIGGIAIYNENEELEYIVSGVDGEILYEENCVIEKIFGIWVNLSEEIVGD